MVEVGIKNFRGHYRTLERCLGRRLGVEIPVDHPLMAWLAKPYPRMFCVVLCPVFKNGITSHTTAVILLVL